MAKETQLITVPSFIFDNGTEIPVQVNYYNGSIELRQVGDFDVPETIILDPAEVKALIKAIVKHQPEANDWLNHTHDPNPDRSESDGTVPGKNRSKAR